MRKAEIDIRHFIKKAAVKKFKSQSKLAQKVGQNRSQLNQFLTGKRDVNLLTFLKYMEALNCSIRIHSDDTWMTLAVWPDDIRQTEIDKF